MKNSPERAAQTPAMAGFCATLSGLPPPNIPTRGRRVARQPRAVIRSPCRAFLICSAVPMGLGFAPAQPGTRVPGCNLSPLTGHACVPRGAQCRISLSCVRHNFPAPHVNRNGTVLPGRGVPSGRQYITILFTPSSFFRVPAFACLGRAETCPLPACFPRGRTVNSWDVLKALKIKLL